jgi:uncharacterized protein (DUF433 family)
MDVPAQAQRTGRRAILAVPMADVARDQRDLLQRISSNPEIFGGKPILRGLRISVETVLSLLAQGEKPEAVLEDYPDLEPDDIRACLEYARATIANDQIDLVRAVGR